MNKLDKQSLKVHPLVAFELGFNNALVLQELYNSYKNNGKESQWMEFDYYSWLMREFPFWGIWTLKGVIRNLVKSGYLFEEHVTTDYNKMVLAYLLNMEKTEELFRRLRLIV